MLNKSIFNKFTNSNDRVNPPILPPKTWKLLIITILLIGIFFRFANIEKKVTWTDENATIFKISGDTVKEWDNHFTGLINIEEFHKQVYLPNPKSNVIDVVQNLSKQDAKHTPIYFAMLRLWIDLFGSAITSIRLLSVILGILVFPCLYWLCLELFPSPLVGWLAVALIAVSPFHLLYAQETRPYSLLTVIILFSSAVLLRAIRLKNRLSWGIYAVSLSLAIYTHTLSILVFIAHGIYVISTNAIQRNKVLLPYLISTFIAFLSFLPWLFFIISNYQQLSESLDWQNSPLPFSTLVKNWQIYLSRVFIDLTPVAATENNIFNQPLFIITRIFILILVGYSLYFLCRHASRKAWLFILTLIAIPSLALILPDLILGGNRSSVARYLIPSYLGIHLSVAYLLATNITTPANFAIWRQKIWQMITVILISTGIFSCIQISWAQTWWNKYTSPETPPMARVVNQTNSPLLIADAYWMSWDNIMSMSHILNPKVKVLFLPKSQITQVPDGYSDVFLVNPSEELLTAINQDKQLKIDQVNDLKFWKILK